jgi:hypothetical protein
MGTVFWSGFSQIPFEAIILSALLSMLSWVLATSGLQGQHGEPGLASVEPVRMASFFFVILSSEQ